MASNGRAGALRAQIGVVNAVLANAHPGVPDYIYWTNRLQEMKQDLDRLEMGTQSSAAASAQPSPYSNNSNSTSSDSLAPQPRKRPLELVINNDGPQPKRVSGNPSPLTPTTPDLVLGMPEAQQRSLPKPTTAAPGGETTFIDLTISDPPSPVGLPGLANGSHYDNRPGPVDSNSHGGRRPEPFPELDNAFRGPLIQSGPAHVPNRGLMRHDSFPELDDAFRGNGATPADAFTQESMRPDELAQFLITPGPAMLEPTNQLLTPSAMEGRLGVAFSSTQRPVPYLPSPQRPDWMGQDSDDNADYGDVLLTAGEAESIEKMLEIVEQNGQSTQDDREDTPRIMSSTLKEYQKIGLSWLIKMEDGRNKGGILADEMGLGKTVRDPPQGCSSVKPSDFDIVAYRLDQR
jgi:hypothetical protein